MKRILKYTLEPTDYQVVKLRQLGKILSVESQNEEIVLYALVDDNNPIGHIEVRVIGTGHYAHEVENFEFLGTVKLTESTLMLHVFCDRLEV